MNNRILVTGGAGYIGSHAVFALMDAGWEPVVLDNLSTGLRRLVPNDVAFVEGDVSDGALVGRILKEHMIEGVLHFAGAIDVAESMRMPLKYFQNNTAASRTLIETCIAGGVTAFVFSSSAGVYGPGNAGLIPETAPCAPVSPYGRSKLFTELILRDTFAAHGLPYAALRYFNVSGADAGGRTGQPGRFSNHLITKICETLAGTQEVLVIHGDDYDTPDGTCIRDFVHVSELAAAHVNMLRKLLQEGGEWTLNLGSGNGFSVQQVLETAEAVAGRTIPISIGARRPGDVATLIADCSEAERHINWQSTNQNLSAMIRDSLRWRTSVDASDAEGN